MRYPRWGGRGLCLGAEKIEARKMLVNRADSPLSASRVVRLHGSNGTNLQTSPKTLNMIMTQQLAKRNSQLIKKPEKRNLQKYLPMAKPAEKQDKQNKKTQKRNRDKTTNI